MMKLVVLSCLMAAASASVLGYAGYGYGAPFAYSALYAPSNYRGPLSLAPGQPASILAADGRPLDTLDVNLDRAAHYTAKAYEGAGIHLLKKRSVAFAAPISRVAYGYNAPLAYSAYPYAAAAPLAYSAAYPYAGYPYARAGYSYGYAAPFATALYKK